MFYQNDVPKNPLSNSPEENIEICNIGSFEEIKNIKISTSLLMEAKDKYLALLKAYKYFFSWSCNELKTCDTSLIEHKIPLKPKGKPFKKKLRRINPILLPVIEKNSKRYLMLKL